MTATKKVLITGGGTGGHIYPGLAIARELEAACPGIELLFVGSPRGLESKVVPLAGYSLEHVEVASFVRRLSLKNLQTIYKAAKAYFRAKKIIRNFRPDVVVGTGGYVSGPIVLAAARMKIPTLIQEQNAFPGLTTRMLASRVDKIAVSHKDAVARIKKTAGIAITGHPIRSEFFAVSRNSGRERLGIPEDRRLLLVVGGSGGAARLNHAMLTAADSLLKQPDVEVLHITGARYYQWASQELENLNLPPHKASRYKLVDFMHNIPDAMAACDLIVARSGGMIHEICAVGCPAIYIPSPNVTDDHQLHNARSMAAAGAAVLIEEKDLSSHKLATQVGELLKATDKLAAMARAAKRLGRPDAGQKIAAMVIELAKKKTNNKK